MRFLQWGAAQPPGRSVGVAEAVPVSVLEVREVEGVYLRRDGVPVRAVASANLSVDAGEIVGLVGETGCGKSSLARAAGGLTPGSSGAGGFEGKPVHALGRRARPVVETRLQMVFQNPYGSLNPRRTIGDQVADALVILRKSVDRPARVRDLLARVG